MNVLSTTPPIRSKRTVMHDQVLYHEMMEELLGLAIKQNGGQDPQEQCFLSPPPSMHHLSKQRVMEEYEDYDSDFDPLDDDDDLEEDEVHFDAGKVFKEDATEVTTTDTDFSLNASSWHSSTSHQSCLSSFSRKSRFLFSKDEEEHSAVQRVTPLYVFEDPLKDDSTTTDAQVHCDSLASLQSHGLLGEGFFGQVFLVRTKTTQDTNKDNGFYALKRLSKYHLLCEDQVHTVQREKQILQLCQHHPGIVKLYQTFQDDAYLYLLQSYIPGGELFSLLHHSTNCSVSEDLAQFYTTCITDALWYLHCGGGPFSNRSPIVFRDLKPENIMLDRQGYPILIDFGYAKSLSHPDDAHPDGEPTRTYTLCGTSKYLSPEMIEGSGHGCPTDYWSLGIVVYELLSGGEHPFEFYPQMDDRSLFHSIAEADYLPLPAGVSATGLDFVDQLLMKAPQLRLGATESRTLNPLLEHPWLRSWNVVELRQQSVPAPWVPESAMPPHFTLPSSKEDGLSDDSSHSGDESQATLFHSSTNSHLTQREQARFINF